MRGRKLSEMSSVSATNTLCGTTMYYYYYVLVCIMTMTSIMTMIHGMSDDFRDDFGTPKQEVCQNRGNASSSLL
jgi:hypothetical protein